MGTCIDAVATAHGRGGLFGRGSLHLTDVAARKCLQRAHCTPDQLDLLVNAGLYKNRNAAEPALASIIQEDIGANPDAMHGATHGTFSFDVLNGGCGVITAMQLVEAFVAADTARYGMIVAGDVDPSPRTSRHFPFSPAGGAMLVGHTDDDSGFECFDLRTFSEYESMFGVQLRWRPRAGLLRRGRNVIEVHEEPGFAARCVSLAVDVVSEMLQRTGHGVDDFDLLICSQYPRGFATSVAARLGITRERVPTVADALAAAHTAGPLAALEVAFQSGQFARAARTLFVTAGAGITIGAAIYSQDVRSCASGHSRT